ncbi:unnamed protein product [Peronospora belbahrii]|uniref:Neutral zinc metallopeptidase n=1 Tax=Peronospora belbahrii TaxID=622444 RepID=A0AAU9KZR3_9STRA|nr:unnamed protein product [Peronospora belbahrii]CAH0513780.1 unnamed protein product [Peronospora belbahrii]
MKIRQTARFSTLVAIALLTFAVTSPVISAAKCSVSWLKKQPIPVPVTTTAPEDAAAMDHVQDMLNVAQNSAEDNVKSNGLGEGGSTNEPTGPVKSTPSTSLIEHATFGNIISASGECVIGNPNAQLLRDDIDWVWTNTMSKYIVGFSNLIFDQLVTNNGSLSYCVRWDTDKKLTKIMASKFQAILEKQINLWNSWLVGYDCWPFDKIDITVVAFAVRDKSIMDWSDDSLGMIYEGILDDAGSPMCPDECYKHKGQAASADTSACKGKPFDMSFWPSTMPDKDASGMGGDWGQRVEVNHILDSMNDDHMMVLLHEIGHGFGLPEMYLAENKPSGYPPCVMDDGMTLTDGDGWLLRKTWEMIKFRYAK